MDGGQWISTCWAQCRAATAPLLARCINLSRSLTASPPKQHPQETQTSPEGQIHFFPIIMDGKQLYNTMVERCGPSQGSGPKA